MMWVEVVLFVVLAAAAWWLLYHPTPKHQIRPHCTLTKAPWLECSLPISHVGPCFIEVVSERR